MKIKCGFTYLLLLSFIISCSSQKSSPENTAGFAKPNIIFVLVDDMGWTDLGCYGSSFYETPNIDKLASEGTIFTDAYSAATVCSPSRAAILTGKYPARLHVTDWIKGHQKPFAKLLPPDWTQYLPLEVTTIAEFLKNYGYATASIGKWHLGHDPKFYPENQGFDVNLGGFYMGQPPSYFSPYKMPTLTDGPDGEYLTDRQTDDAINFIKQNKEKPFFIYLPYYTVHQPLQSKEADTRYFTNKVNEDSAQRNPVYAGMIKNLDDNMGRITSVLNSLNIAQNTILIFTSDNGGLIAQNPSRVVTSNIPLRAGKGSAYEGGVRVPAIVTWPGKIKSGTVNRSPIMGIDFFPTIANIIDPKAILPANIDGVNLLPSLLNHKEVKRDALFWHYPHYHPGGSTTYSAVRRNNWKLIYFYETGKKELYNLSTDLSEKNDLSLSNPQLTERLYQEMVQWKKSVNAQDPVPNPKYNANQIND